MTPNQNALYAFSIAVESHEELLPAVQEWATVNHVDLPTVVQKWAASKIDSAHCQNWRRRLVNSSIRYGPDDVLKIALAEYRRWYESIIKVDAAYEALMAAFRESGLAVFAREGVELVKGGIKD